MPQVVFRDDNICAGGTAFTTWACGRGQAVDGREPWRGGLCDEQGWEDDDSYAVNIISFKVEP